ncbi:FAD:protein FMN transferase [Undibacterium sp. Jales W-56]|uniref:FAD:protein FMN transferase n=1 Tax=Undibacterium sp. Jales W-56 TaxID=2897325 RepID=UPI0021CE308C|nr:FAD:protein FMN transferase [Undibacterium sp. Jales W-56]MCU6434033.1 FAD:protein FMN transferase [Undibacterium sp. Jales W-56]
MSVFQFPFIAMASQCEIRLAAPDKKIAETLASSAINEVRRIEISYSRYRPDSIVARINAAASKDWIECDQETFALLDYAHALYLSSDGLFDITSGVLRQAWDFRQPLIPADETLQSLLSLVGWSQVKRDVPYIHLPRSGMEIDFGGFGKEYAADRAAAILAEAGIEHGYVNLGGDMRFIGPQPDGQAWSIGIQHPRHAGRMIAHIPVSRGALATSGDYERFFEVNGQRYCHILDPRDGMPVTHWRSISVLGPLAIVAGSCATIAMLKQEDGVAFLENSGMGYLAVDHQGNIRSKNLQDPVVSA